MKGARRPAGFVAARLYTGTTAPAPAKTGWPETAVGDFLRPMKPAMKGGSTGPRSVSFDADTNSVCLLDQRLLPHRVVWVRTPDHRATARAIRDMVVRGAPAIAAAAAYGLAQGIREYGGRDLRRFRAHVRQVHATLLNARPTAVDPARAMQEVLDAMRRGRTVPERQALALAAAEEFAHRSALECRALGEQGLRLMRDGISILTHCNAGRLACVDHGTATAPLYLARERGMKFHVYCTETRPRSQGAALTAWELAQAGIPHTIVPDTAVGLLMQQRRVDLVLVGSDRVLGRTGDVTNKIGTYQLAVLARRHGIPFYVAIPLSTLDWHLRSPRQIPIEERDAEEVLCARGAPVVPKGSRTRPDPITVRVANPGSPAWNPAFDITPAELVTGILTPVGLFKPGELWANRHALGYRTGSGTTGV
jgi:methylthioribose-1-phosphate isomerase